MCRLRPLFRVRTHVMRKYRRMLRYERDFTIRKYVTSRCKLTIRKSEYSIYDIRVHSIVLTPTYYVRTIRQMNTK